MLEDAAVIQKAQRLAALLRQGESQAEVRHEAFAVVADAVRRKLRLTVYDTQLTGALAMAQGKLVQMGTGEGKTLVAAFVAYWNFVQGHPVHVCTVNEYLALRDMRTLEPVYELLGMKAATVLSGQTVAQKRFVYDSDVVYGVHAQFALDYLRDNLARVPKDQVQVRARHALIVDEADSVLLDEALMPFGVHASVASDASMWDVLTHKIVPQLELADPAQSGIADLAWGRSGLTGTALFKALGQALGTPVTEHSEDTPGDFFLDTRLQLAVLTESGYERVTQLLVEHGLLQAHALEDEGYQAGHQVLLQKVVFALTARYLLHAGVHYLVQDGTLVAIDALTGRPNPERSWVAPLLQALRVKEGLPAGDERRLLASMPAPSFYRDCYAMVCGMSGTLISEREELLETYGLKVQVIPSNRPCVRVDAADRLFQTQSEKLDALLSDIQTRHASKQPVLVGTMSVAQSERLSERLDELGLPHEVLNARNHAREAEILERAGMPGAITVTTRMAGRGVDIVLGGSPARVLLDRQIALGVPAWEALSDDEKKAFVSKAREDQAAMHAEVVAAGGLYAVGLERYNSERMDQQLRGRAGRQGDPGESRFYIAMDDPLVQDFAREKIAQVRAQLELKPGDELEHALVLKAIDGSQRSLQEQARTARTQQLTLDEVMNEQRRAYYAWRQSILSADPGQAEALFDELLVELAQSLTERYLPDSELPEHMRWAALQAWLAQRQAPLMRGQTVLSFETRQDVLDFVDSLGSLRTQDLQNLVLERLRQARVRCNGQLSDERERVAAQKYVVLSAMDPLWFSHLDSIQELRAGIHLRGHARQNPMHVLRHESGVLFGQMMQDMRQAMASALLNWTYVQTEAQEGSMPA